MTIGSPLWLVGTISSKLLPISDLHFGQPSVEAIKASLQSDVRQQKQAASGREGTEMGNARSQYAAEAEEVLQALLM